MAVPLRSPAPIDVVGQSVPRLDGRAKVTGAARYTDDLVFPGAWYGKTIRSTVPRGVLRSVTANPAFDWDQAVLVTAADIPGDNVVQLIRDDQPALVEREIRHREEPIALLAAPDRDTLEAAATHVQVEQDRLDPLLDLDDATDVLADLLIDKGDVRRALAEAEIVVERTFRMGHQEQLYIEPQGAIAVPTDDGGVTIYGSLQCPYYVHQAVVRTLGVSEDKVVVIPAEVGGAFGGKEEYPSMVAIHAALLAVKARRPVRVIYDRHEDIAATTKRHPGVIRHRTGVRRDGTLVAQDIEIVLDGGAYCTLSPVVLSRSAIHAAGPYACPNVRIRGRAMATNTPPNGAFRGFGAPQSQFAAELMVEHVAAALGRSSIDVRRMWMLREGDTTATGQTLRESVGTELVLDAALRNAPPVALPSNPTRLHGRGVSLVFHGSGFTGSGEKKLGARVAVECTAKDEFRVLTSQTEMGQGTTTILAQIAADTLGVPLERVTIPPQDTSVVPNSGPTVASRTVMIVGQLVAQAAGELRQRLESERPPLRVEKAYVQPSWIRWNDEQYRGDAYPAYAFACVVVDVEVDTDTGEIRVTDLVAALDPGTAIHPVMVEGQMEGGVLQAVGYATIEEMKMADGGYVNDRLATYIIPTALDAPRIKTVLVENPYSGGPFGAKGIGEIPMDCPAPAVIAAIHDATGVWLNELPATPEKLLAAMSA
ncbi:MAG: xanthine dehydrogenase family protein molybdopterin-binding subunit [Gemmatimonadota bacterium]|nr:xanthine dehydrogenase family protein molybdopterin-binding subunit [Gemmatimonadota bacterium]MDH3366828.1 xanthine dehydrogenase family protein molybdopterin-binding subunit [Gemmatimonadota bacterium]MDH3479644.1 xanthine dehydrogenase family protein molybdopterin-binding subunit [Gemmatimonadota bacterium]MDH5548913.1 xanthine dehydrogenase family protein molybdopterin-binding subunit [Gemmatimonadota bacterium]